MGKAYTFAGQFAGENCCLLDIFHKVLLWNKLELMAVGEARGLEP